MRRSSFWQTSRWSASPLSRALSALSATLLALIALSACDGDGLQTSQSADYIVRPYQEFVFPTVVVGQTTTKEIEVENIGEIDLQIARALIQTDMSAEGEFTIYYQLPGASEYEEIPFEENSTTGYEANVTYPIIISPGEVMKLKVVYAPADELPDQGALYFDTNVSDEQEPERARINIPIRVASGDAQMSVTPAILDFDVVPVGESKTMSVTVTNVGASVLRLSDLRIDGSSDFIPLIDGRDPRRQPELLIDPDGDGIDGISPFDPEVPGSGQLTLEVKYEPQIAGPDDARLVIDSNDANTPAYTINLLANSRNPCLNVLPSALEFPASLVSRTDSRPVTLESCGGAALEITDVRIEGDVEGVFRVEDALELPLLLPAAPPQGERPSTSLSISFSPREQKIYNATLVISNNDPVAPERRVNILGRGAENICPQARAAEDEFLVYPLDTVVLDGSPSVDQDGPNNLPVEYEWVITSRPEGSVSQPVERFNDPQQPADGGLPDDRATPFALFFIDLPGYYTAELRVRDQFGLDSVACRNPAVVTIVAEPDEAIQVQLSWQPISEEDLGRERAADLDVHMRHPNAPAWFTSPYDCYFNNPTPDWGQLNNPQDDPFLDLDDFSSNGPENLTLAVPESTEILGGEYVVGVDYYRQTDRVDGYVYGPARAYVRVFIEGVLAWDYTSEGQDGFKDMMAEGHFWEAASISWPTGEVRTVDVYYEERPGE
jgi:hypothetical protein